MSMHNMKHPPGLREAMMEHHLVTGKPSQVGDAFRLGWLAHEKHVARPSQVSRLLAEIGERTPAVVHRDGLEPVETEIVKLSYPVLADLMGRFETPDVGSRWLHQKTGFVYYVVSVSFQKKKLDILVTYARLENDIWVTWTTDLEDWTSGKYVQIGYFSTRF